MALLRVATAEAIPAWVLLTRVQAHLTMVLPEAMVQVLLIMVLPVVMARVLPAMAAHLRV